MTAAVEVRERPVLFSALMVRAILEGRKAQTRRIVKPQPEHRQYHEHKGKTLYDGENRMWCWKELVLDNIWDFPNGQDRRTLAAACPYGQPGDQLWVRETHWRLGRWVKNGLTKSGKQAWAFIATLGPGARFIPDYKKPGREEHGWHKRPAIFLPRKHCRITLEITGVRVERLQEISTADVVAEGVDVSDEPEFSDIYVQRYRHLWDSINGKKAPWSSNPWLWVIEFRQTP